MCGPLVLALPVHHMRREKQAFAVVLYNAGRIITYSLIGLLLGLAGRRIYLAGFQQWFTISLGIVMLLAAFRYFYQRATVQPKWMWSFHGAINHLMIRFLQSKNVTGYLLLGVANGLLPCGMVYLAIAGALTAPTVANSVLFMALFGTGTLPAMLALGLFGLRISLPVRQRVKTAMPFVMAAMAVLLILRGLNLGIPFISPVIADAPGHVISCH